MENGKLFAEKNSPGLVFLTFLAKIRNLQLKLVVFSCEKISKKKLFLQFLDPSDTYSPSARVTIGIIAFAFGSSNKSNLSNSLCSFDNSSITHFIFKDVIIQGVPKKVYKSSGLLLRLCWEFLDEIWICHRYRL